MKILLSICTIALTISSAYAVEAASPPRFNEPAKTAGPQQYPSQAAALAALTAPRPSGSDKSTSAGKAAAEDDDEIEELPADAPTISNVQTNMPVAGETGQL